MSFRLSESHATVPENLQSELDGRLTFAVELARLAGSITLKHYQSSRLEWERKSDNSPVTVADREAETEVRKLIAQRFPSDAVEGEEFGGDSRESSAEFAWIIDPIDGTKSFLSGVPLYSTLVGLTRNGEPIAGVIYIPALNEIIFAATGLGAWHSAGGQPFSNSKVSDKSELGECIFVLSQVDSFDRYATDAAYRGIERECYITRTWGDGYGYLLVATGRADLMVDPVVNAWDVAAVLPVIEESGGKCTDWKGDRTIRGGSMLGSNGHIHSKILAKLS